MARTKGISTDELLDAVREHGSNRSAAKALGLNSRTVDRRMQQIKRDMAAPEVGGMPSMIPEHFFASKITTLTDKEGARIQWQQAKPDQVRQREVLNDILKACLEEMPKLPARVASGEYLPDLLACYLIGDAHIGMRAWDEECGENWDLKIAEKTQCGAMAALVKNTPAADSAVIINLGDWFHYDSLQPVTSRSGNVLDVDGRYAKVVRLGVKIMRQCIESALERHKQVRVINVIGNHDDTGAIWLSAALANMYENEPRVNVDTSPGPRQYFEHGKCMVCCHHGHTTKPDGMPAMMAAEQAEMWGRTLYRFAWLGHVHHERVKEHPGVKVESWNTLAPRDAYSAWAGYHSDQAMTSVVLHREYGDVARFRMNPRMLA